MKLVSHKQNHKIQLERKIIFFLFLVAIALMSTLALFYYTTQKIKSTSDLMKHAEEVLHKSDNVLLDIINIETGSKGYILTGNELFLEPFNNAVASINHNLAELAILTKDNPNQQLRINSLRKIAKNRLIFTKKIIDLRKRNGLNGIEKIVGNGKEKILAGKIRNIIISINSEEFSLLELRKKENDKNARYSGLIFLSLLIFILVILILVTILSIKNQKTRNKLENLLKEYKHFFNNSNDLICIANMQGYFEILNPRFEEVLGYSEKELLANQFLDFIHPDDITATLQEIEKLKAGIRTINFVNRYHKKDGSYLWFDWNATPNPITGKLYAVAHDITKKKKTEEFLQKNLKEISDYKHALDESAIVAITDLKGSIKFVNENFCEISKYNKTELLGQDHRIINSGHHSKDFFKELYSTITKGKIWRGDIKNKAKDGTYYWVDTTIVPFLNKEGKPFKYVSIRTDITDRKKAEAQLVEVNKELEAFSYSVSHDLRAPLRAVNGYAQMLNEDYGSKLDEEGKRIIEAMKNNSTAMGALIDDLLAFSRLGRKEIQKSNIDMNQLINGVLNDMDKSNAHCAEIKIGKLHNVKADYSLIYQVMFNLISNAIKYSSKKKHPLVEIFSEEKNNEIIFSVKDNGVGFDMQFAHKLFGVFQRLHKTKDFDGTGVGLAIVQRIINKHGGKIWVEAELEKGATFYFVLLIN